MVGAATFTTETSRIAMNWPTMMIVRSRPTRTGVRDAGASRVIWAMRRACGHIGTSGESPLILVLTAPGTPARPGRRWVRDRAKRGNKQAQHLGHEADEGGLVTERS